MPTECLSLTRRAFFLACLSFWRMAARCDVGADGLASGRMPPVEVQCAFLLLSRYSHVRLRRAPISLLKTFEKWAECKKIIPIPPHTELQTRSTIASSTSPCAAWPYQFRTSVWASFSGVNPWSVSCSLTVPARMPPALFKSAAIGPCIVSG